MVGCSSDDDTGKGGGNLTGDSGAPDGEANGGGGTPDLDPLPEDVTLPIVFLHGFVGSAQQYESQAMRFAANGYPWERIRAYEHPGDQSAVQADVIAGTDALIDSLREEFDVDQVFLVGHSRGTLMSSVYLGDAGRAAKVAKYVSLDGGGCGAAEGAGVECIAPNQAGLPGQAHVEVATSAESFEMQYKFLVGEDPQVVDIVRQGPKVEISGRAVDFPSNEGMDGTTLEIWEIDSETGQRAKDEPLDTFEIDESGDFGPVTVSPDKHYEMALDNPASGVQHFYYQPWLRSSHFVRLLSGQPDTSFTRMNTVTDPGHAVVIAMRMREWYSGDDPDNDGDESDVLEISTKSESGDQDTVNAIQSYMGNGSIAIHIHDAITPEESSLEELPNFAGQPFQTSVDVYMPAADPPEGTITLRNLPRGETDKPQVLNFPNWPSEGHFISAMFADYAQVPESE